MSQQTDLLKIHANQIKNEVADGANTASRVGGAILEAANLIETHDTQIKEHGDRLNDLGLKTEHVESETTEEGIESIDIYNDDKTVLLHHIDKDGADFKNLKSNGKDVLIPQISQEDTEDDMEEEVFASDDYDENGQGEIYATIGNKGISAKDFYYINGRKLKDMSFLPIIVDKSGKGDYTSISLASSMAKDGSVIIVMPGVYEESITFGKKELHIIGVCKEKTIIKTGDGIRELCPITAGRGSLVNLTIIDDDYNIDWSQKTIEACYGVHIDQSDSELEHFEFLIKNCKIISKNVAAIGCGVRKNQKIIIDDCELISEHTGTNYGWSNCITIHPGYNKDHATIDDATIVVKNCVMKSNCRCVNLNSSTELVKCTDIFIGNTMYSSLYGIDANEIVTADKKTQGREDVFDRGNGHELGIMSHNNNINLFNY